MNEVERENIDFSYRLMRDLKGKNPKNQYLMIFKNSNATFVTKIIEGPLMIDKIIIEDKGQHYQNNDNKLLISKCSNLDLILTQVIEQGDWRSYLINHEVNNEKIIDGIIIYCPTLNKVINKDIKKLLITRNLARAYDGW